ncbi:MAG: hypothetical protein A2Y71_00090 [Bacteroidetes bacterium RBG_13_42_15]|nr:MAG: hypothetical protein A2Y71_00090 [Bacteroidetes bacterium RBG_13_42_15]
MLFLQNHILLIFKYIFCLLILFCEPISAQQFNIKTFTTRDGLSHNDVRAAAVDSSGFLWIATWDGLSRYDGYSFKNYYHKTDDSLSLPYFSILNVLVDGGNNLWLLTDDKLVVKYDRNNDIFQRIDNLYEGLPEFYSQISIDDSGYIWLITDDRIYRYDFLNNEFNKYELFDHDGSPRKILSDGGAYSVSHSGNKNIWLVYKTIFEFEISPGNKLILKREYSIDNKARIKEYDFHYNYWYRIYFSNSGRKWIFSNVGLFLLDDKTGVFMEFRDPLPEKEFIGNGFLFWSWLGDGIYIINQKEAKMSHVPHDFCQMVKGIICQDKNLIWFSNNSITGASMGLNRVIFTPDYFKSYLLLTEKNDMPAVYAITEDRDNNIWVGTRGKDPLIKISRDMKSTILKIPEYNTLLDPGAIRSLNATPDGLWIGFFRELLLFYNFDSGQFTKYNPESNNFRPIALDKGSNLYLCGENGNELIRFSPMSQKTEKRIRYSPETPIYKILIDKQGMIWVGMSHCRLLRYDPYTEKSEIYSLSNSSYNIEDICQGDNEDMWLALLGSGVCNFDIITGKKTFYNTSQGLANNMTYSILKDKSGNIWVSTNTGISRINPATGIIRTFGLNEGLRINEFNSGASYIDESGKFFMGGMGGLVSFHPDLINTDELEAVDQRIIVNEIRVSGETRHFRRSVIMPDTIILNKGEDDFQVFFSSSDFNNSEKTVYRYKLSGINDNWIETDSHDRSVNYANLKPGLYNLQLQASDRIGAWSAMKNIVIRIHPFYYQTLLFRIAVPVAILLLITGMILLYIRQLNQRAAQKQDALRLQSLQGQMNPHFIFNSLNSINYFISKNDALSANRYIADFSKLIRSIIYNFNSDFINLEKEIESLDEYLKIEHLRFGDKFNYKVIIEPDVETARYKVSPGLVQPFIENAIWHGMRGLSNRKGNVMVRYASDNEKLTCIIEDDGIGRKNAEALKSMIDKKESRGILLVTERLKIINNLQKSDLQVIISDLYPDKNETGTKVIIDIPFNKN